MEIEVVVDAKASLGEGVLWDDRTNVVWWVDILESKLYRHDPQTGENTTFDCGSHIGTVALRDSGGLVLATVEDGIVGLDPETGEFDPIAHPAAETPSNRYNDGKPGPNGCLYFGTMAYDAQEGAASLYRVSKGGTFETLIPGITIANGITWTADTKTMYYIDSPTMQIAAYDYDIATGQIANRRVVVPIPDSFGTPDGMTIDTEGKLWVAHFGGNAVNRWDPETGEHLLKIPLPASNITSCTFGGPDFDTLYITSARVGLSEEQAQSQPLAGALFKVKPGFTGRPANRYNG